jgi:hypothetical protein
MDFRGTPFHYSSSVPCDLFVHTHAYQRLLDLGGLQYVPKLLLELDIAKLFVDVTGSYGACNTILAIDL